MQIDVTEEELRLILTFRAKKLADFASSPGISIEEVSNKVDDLAALTTVVDAAVTSKV